MLATGGPLPTGPGWRYEVKWDGIRGIVQVCAARVTVRTRGGRDVSAVFPELAELADVGRDLHLDGEIVVFGDNGRPDFDRVRRRLGRTGSDRVARAAAAAPAIFVVFDILARDGHRLVAAPYWQRRQILSDALPDGPAWRVPLDYSDGAGLLAATGELGLEGIVAKRSSSRYQPGRRSRNWVKVKHRQRSTVVVAGWVPTGSGEVAQLLVGKPGDDQRIHYAGRVELGIGRVAGRNLARLLVPRTRERCAFGWIVRDAVWVDPDVFVAVDHGSATTRGMLREPYFRGVTNHPVW